MTDSFNKGMYLMIEGKIHFVLDRKYKTQGRQGGLIILDLKNMDTGSVSTQTVTAGTKFDQIEVETREFQYLYSDDKDIYLMDNTTFETVNLALSVVGEYKNYLKEGDSVLVVYGNDQIIAIRENPTVKLTVTEADDAVKGDTSSNATKIVVTETGLKVNVPLFVKKGDVIIINTETGKYNGRG